MGIIKDISKKVIHYALLTCFALFLGFLLLLIFLYKQVYTLSINSTTYTSSKIPVSFNNYRIVQLSDLHSQNFGYKQSRLIHHIKALHPDLIVITGDLIDGNTKKQAPCLDLLHSLPDIAPTYYIYGNHESRILYNKKLASFFDKVEGYGVTILYNQSVTLTSDKNESINLLGITDPNTIRKDAHAPDIYYAPDRIAKLLELAFATCSDPTRFNLLLSHRPEFLSTYAKYPVDLVLCGHVHGGQIRLPFIGGLYSSDQGYFPKYDAGYYYKKNTTMYVSRGLGTGSFPLRLFNLPEINLITLRSNQS